MKLLRLACAAVTVAALPTLSQAQVTPPAPATATATAPVTATVTGSLSVTSSGTTSFGTFTNNPHTETINPITPGAGKSTAVFNVRADGVRNVFFTCSETVTLSGPNNSTLLFRPALALGGAQGTPITDPAAACPAFGVVSLLEANIYVGGSIVIGSTPPAAGAYSGTFTLSVNY